MVDLREGRLDDLYQALSNTTRRRIVSLLSQNPRSISELVPSFGMSLAAVSKHVKLLERAGIVDCRQKGRAHICRLVPEGMSEALEWLSTYERFWQDRMDALDAVLAEDAANDEGAT